MHCTYNYCKENTPETHAKNVGDTAFGLKKYFFLNVANRVNLTYLYYTNKDKFLQQRLKASRHHRTCTHVLLFTVFVALQPHM